MSASSLIFGSSGNIVSLVFLLMRGGGTPNPMLNVYQLIIAKIVISVKVLYVIFSLN